MPRTCHDVGTWTEPPPEEVNVAVTLLAALMVTLHVLVPLHAPPQPPKVQPLLGLAVNVTAVPLEKLAVQVEPQSIPLGDDVTEPLPVVVTVNAKLLTGITEKAAVTFLAALIVTVQVPVPLQAPLQPSKVEPAVALAVNVTLVPLEKLTEQVEPQLIPAGDDVTVPLPLVVTAKAKLFGGVTENVAVTFFAEFIVTLQVPVPLHAPPHPSKVEPAVALAVNTTALFAVKERVQSLLQFKPAGADVTDPCPDTVTRSDCVALPPELEPEPEGLLPPAESPLPPPQAPSATIIKQEKSRLATTPRKP